MVTRTHSAWMSVLMAQEGAIAKVERVVGRGRQVTGELTGMLFLMVFVRLALEAAVTCRYLPLPLKWVVEALFLVLLGFLIWSASTGPRRLKFLGGLHAGGIHWPILYSVLVSYSAIVCFACSLSATHQLFRRSSSCGWRATDFSSGLLRAAGCVLVAFAGRDTCARCSGHSTPRTSVLLHETNHRLADPSIQDHGGSSSDRHIRGFIQNAEAKARDAGIVGDIRLRRTNLTLLGIELVSALALILGPLALLFTTMGRPPYQVFH